ncbi:MAG: hypothetical protein RSD67_02485 [Oscillospiraceae bacterium]
MASYNQFTSLPFIIYRIIMQMVTNDNICKLLKYPEYDCLSKPNLTYDEKMAMIWKNPQFDRMENYNIFMTNTMANMMTDAISMLQIYRYDSKPINYVISTICYRLDFLFGSKTAMVEYEGIPCNRGDVFEMEIMKSLNGKDVAGVGFLQYNSGLSRLCGSNVSIGNNNTFTGVSIVFATQISDIGGGDNDCS